jgi:A/G-specific adenine glycosylase
MAGVTRRLPPPASPAPATVRRLHRLLLGWWDRGHRDLPWRRTRDPYAILVSEVMLQQTQVSRVIPKYQHFLARFPDLHALAAAAPAEVIQAWSGLGYNRRAVNLHRLARVAVAEHGGALPGGADGLRTLPGIGGYTARAVASIAWDEPVAAVDTNVRRVLARVIDGLESQRSISQTQALADALLARERPGDWNQALMELGALVCLPVPQCAGCPLRQACRSAGSATVIRERRAAYRAGRDRRAPAAGLYRCRPALARGSGDRPGPRWPGCLGWRRGCAAGGLIPKPQPPTPKPWLPARGRGARPASSAARRGP